MADWFKDVRDAVAAAFSAKLTAESATDVTVTAMDLPDVNAVDLPAVLVTYNGSEQEVGGTNVRDDYGYPIQLGLYTIQADNGISGSESPPGLSATQFRQYVREKFHRQRAVTVSGIDCFLCEYDPTGAVIDEANPAYQQLRAVAVVTVYARVPRGAATAPTAPTVWALLTPRTIADTDPVEGSAVDLTTSPPPALVVIVCVGDTAAGTEVSVMIQESTTGSSWSITDPVVITTANGATTWVIEPTTRYVRARVTLGGVASPSAEVSAVLSTP